MAVATCWRSAAVLGTAMFATCARGGVARAVEDFQPDAGEQRAAAVAVRWFPCCASLCSPPLRRSRRAFRTRSREAVALAWGAPEERASLRPLRRRAPIARRRSHNQFPFEEHEHGRQERSQPQQVRRPPPVAGEGADATARNRARAGQGRPRGHDRPSGPRAGARRTRDLRRGLRDGDRRSARPQGAGAAEADRRAVEQIAAAPAPARGVRVAGGAAGERA